MHNSYSFCNVQYIVYYLEYLPQMHILFSEACLIVTQSVEIHTILWYSKHRNNYLPVYITTHQVTMYTYTNISI